MPRQITEIEVACRRNDQRRASEAARRANAFEMPPHPIDDQRLPAHLAERTVRLNARPVRSDGEFVLCWLHHAIRADENPAIDVAISIGNSLSRPVLVYQGLGGRHRFNSDRHHVFIMEGARDLQAALATRGISCVFHLPSDPATHSPMGGLLERACAFVTEDFPAPPFPEWTARWAGVAKCAALAVDAACVMPIRLHRKRFTRAFAFRDASKAEWDARLRQPWHDVDPVVPARAAESLGLEFETVDLSAANLDDLAAGCQIDHSIPPIRRISGGSAAGYARWTEFQSAALRRYDKRRNDAADPGAVSGLSPYLHHGHVSPLRIAREANEHGGSGAAKFLDELLVWRELAFNFCAHTDPSELETLHALPAWARETLLVRTDDAREALYSWETLARGQTGDDLWDAAQRSLLRDGWLHNNLRMTWGKMIPLWTEHPSEALRVMIDLNHRYALDGSNPNSYGGLLWCLGQFDRPFSPEEPVLGSVRPRSSQTHARRIDVAQFNSVTASRAGVDPLRVAVVGAGMAGLAAARTLSDQGCEVAVFDRGRRPGGRLSTRRVDSHDGRLSDFDHGAPFFTVTDPRFGRHVRSWIADGVCNRWRPRCAVLQERDAATVESGPLVVGIPRMRSVIDHVASDLKVESGANVESITRGADRRWRLVIENHDDPRAFDALVLAAAPSQTARLIHEHAPDIEDSLRDLIERPTWVTMIDLDADLSDSPEIVHLETSDSMRMIVREDAKPGRSIERGRSRWVAHSHADWAHDRLDCSREEIRDEMVRETIRHLAAISGQPIPEERVTGAAAHRWSFAEVAIPHPEDCIADPERRVVVAGDGLGGSGVQAAFLSGQAAAARVLSWRPARDDSRSEDRVESDLLFHQERE